LLIAQEAEILQDGSRTRQRSEPQINSDSPRTARPRTTPAQNQQNEIQILLNQARTHENRNQLRQAIEIYEDLYNRFPHHENIVEAYLRVLFAMSDFQKAKTVLANSQNNMPPYFLLRQEVVYLTRTNEINLAERKAFDWLRQNPGMMQHYRELAQIFEASTLFDIAIKIYNQNRQVARDNNLYTLELSNAYYFIRNVENFFEEAIKHLRTNPGFLYFFRNRFIEFLRSDNQNIRHLERLLGNIEPEQVLELYAYSLVEVKDFRKATEIYQRLPLQKMIKFADDLLSGGHVDFALQTYKIAIEKADTPAILADVQMKCAQIYFRQNKFDECIRMLQSVINNVDIQRPPVRHRTRANVEARIMMAQINIKEDKPIEDVRRWFSEATQFANNQIERSDIQFSLSRYLYLKEEYQQAHRVITEAVAGHDPSTNIYKQSNFYRYEIALFQNSAIRDSLLTECIIHFPGDERITQMLFFETFISMIPPDHLPHFLTALRHKGLMQNHQAVETLITVAEQTNIDELFLLAYDWALQDFTLQNSNLLKRIESHNFKNPVLKDFIFLQAIRKNDNDAEMRNSISDFLNNSPHNVFSPQLRLLLFESRRT
jgi:tetratricopeptide (TPR) repeat protein